MLVKWLMLVCLLIAVPVAVGCAPTKAPEAKAPAGYERLRMVGSTIGSEATTTVMSYAALFNRHYPEIEWSSCSGATGTNPIYITNGTIRLASLMPSNYVDAYGFDKVPESRLRSINAPRPPSAYVFLIPEDKPWKDITEVPKGLTLCPGSPGTTLPVCCEAVLKVAGLSKKDFNWVPLGKGELSDAWRAGKVDFVFQSIGGMSPSLMDMHTSPRKFKPMGMTPEQVAKAKAEKSLERIGFEAPSQSTLSQILPEIFKNDVLCPHVPAFLCCRDDFPDEIAYQMARIIDEQREEFCQIYPATKHGATPQHHIRWARPPVDIHSGVAKYYRDKGYLK